MAPLLVDRCQGCHGPEKVKGKYRLDTFERLRRRGAGDAPPLTPGKPDESELYRLLVTPDEDDRMPKKGDRLPDEQVRLVKRWIEQGAAFDGPDPAAALSTLTAGRASGGSEYPAPPDVYPHPVPVVALAFSPDGKELAVGGYNEVTIWDPATGKLLHRIRGVAQRTQALAYSPDGSLLATAGGTPGKFGEVVLLDPAAGTRAKALERIGDLMLAVRFSPDGTRLAAGGADNAIRVYDVPDGRRRLLIEQHADWVTDVAFSPDGGRIASASRDKSCRVFDAKTGATEAAYPDHEEQVLGVAWAADGKSVFSAGRDRKVHQWSAADGKRVGQITGFDADVFRVEAAMGALFVTSADGKVRQYSQDKRELVRTFDGPGDWVYSVAVQGKARRVAVGSYDGGVRVWDVDDGRVVASFVASPGRQK